MAMPRRISRLVLLTGLVLALVLVLHLMPSSPPPPFPSSSAPKFVPATLDWAKVKQFYPPASIKPLPGARPRNLPRVQAPASAFASPSPRAEDRRAAVRNAFKRSYDAYKEHAWMRDELTPVSGRSRDPFGGWAATLVDTLDTLWIMGFDDDFAEASAAVCTIDWADTAAGAANLFETTIRHLGGLLSAYDLSADPALLAKARELGEMLYHGFDTPNRLPGFWLNFKEARDGNQVAGTNDPSAAPASLSLEFTRLSQLTGDAKFYDAADRVTRFLERTQNETLLPGMWPTTLDFRNERATEAKFTLGALADSLYEYLPKMHALLGGVDDTYEKLYRAAMDAAASHLVFRPMLPDKKDVLFAGDWHANAADKLIPDSQHLTCFVGGMFGLGGRLFNIDHHVALGERLARGCGWAYASFPTGVMPEIFSLLPCPSLDPCPWDEDRWQKHGDAKLAKGFTNARDARYLLRPEAIESIFVLYRITAKPELQDMAWDMFQGIMKSTETKLANSAIADVTVTGQTTKTDSMESFWMAETLKYFYLIFSPPDLISLDEYVLNTEAHPMRRPT
ncbi:glycosyl hydrolase family 47 protein [Hirsutella rhossiliensis]|uniref:alpha-1,2-Mannosidase n=1 Tax=Hirsutella rhossiliensis TaxID=111463 RepID=A0A9P8MYC3_9HYPO|nr:glycosyl hydrolase family 47 protein [Hirsutella rhossiliensis]KAH0963535.1 glycosyl hydrolase family 47 protein [Hirsutella rhossiliensis]